MRIVHICIGCHFTEGLTYQENYLVDQNALDGHDVVVITDVMHYVEGELSVAGACDKRLKNGVRLIRLNFDKSVIFGYFYRKVRKTSGLLDILLELSPDSILYHGVAGAELNSVRNYMSKNPKTKLFIDSHEDYNNSARNWLARFFMYKCFYFFLVKRITKYVDRFLYVTVESKDFLKDIYLLDEMMMEYYPLGGVIQNNYDCLREVTRSSLDICNQDIMFLQTGKFVKQKKLEESLIAFSKTKDPKFKFIIAGVLSKSLAKQIKSLVKSDDRISYLGWVGQEYLESLLCAADVYVQPGSQSATMQMSMCSKCVTILADVPSHRYIFDDNGWLVNTDLELENVFKIIEMDKNSLVKMSEKSFEFAKANLNYKKLSERYL